MNNDIFFESIKSNKFFPASFKDNTLNKYPKFQALSKNSFISKKFTLMWFFALIFSFLKKVSFGKIDVNFENRTTTQGYRIYLGNDWNTRTEFSKYRLIIHEIEHMRQWKTFKYIYPITYLLNIWSLLGIIVGLLFNVNFFILLLLLIGSILLPAGISLRGFWEYVAFRTELDAYKKTNAPKILKSDIVNKYVVLLTGSSYYFAFLFIKKIFKKKVEKFVNSLSDGVYL